MPSAADREPDIQFVLIKAACRHSVTWMMMPYIELAGDRGSQGAGELNDYQLSLANLHNAQRHGKHVANQGGRSV